MLEKSRSAKHCNAVPMLSPAALQVYARPHLADKALAERILEAAGDGSCCHGQSRARCCLHSQATACHARRCRTLSRRLPSQLVDMSFCIFADDPRAFDAFLSILFAPQASAGSFDDMLRSIQRHGLPILLVYGREDPWVRTIWGQRIVRIVPQAAFYQVTDPASRRLRLA
jgi:pimeloyl-ACP methyl ester carboxylesterase